MTKILSILVAVFTIGCASESEYADKLIAYRHGNGLPARKIVYETSRERHAVTWRLSGRGFVAGPEGAHVLPAGADTAQEIAETRERSNAPIGLTAFDTFNNQARAAMKVRNARLLP